MPTNLEQFISDKYNNNANWFVNWCDDAVNQGRINDIIDCGKYLDGNHNILYRPDEIYKGKTYKTRKIVLSYAETIFDFHTSYLLDNPVTLSGAQSAVNTLNKVYKNGNFNLIDYKLLNNLMKFGSSYEYLYYDKDRNIQSHIISSENSFPIYNEINDMIGFVEYWLDDGIGYWTVYTDETIYQWTNNGGHLHLTDQYYNASGLPISYVNVSDTEPLYGRSDLEDYISILDDLEYLISKATDAYSHYITGIPVVKGQANFNPQIPEDIIGAGLQLDDTADFDFKSNNFDEKAFKTLYDTAMQELLDTSHVPQAAFSNASIANVSEVSIRMMYQVCRIKASKNKKIMVKGFNERINQIRKMLETKGIHMADESFESIGFEFNENIPSNDTEVIGNINNMVAGGTLSLQTSLEVNPYVHDVTEEMRRLEEEKKNNVSQNVPQEINGNN